jgi:O-antigen ligase
VAATSLVSRPKTRAYTFIALVGFFPVAVNPFGVPTFGLPKLTFLRIGAAVLAALLAADILGAGSGAGGRAKRRVTWWPLGLLAGSAVLSTVFSASWAVSVFGAYNRWEGLWTLAVYWVIFAAAARWGRSRVMFERLWPWLLGVGLLVSALGILEFFHIIRIGDGMDLFCAAGFGAAKATSSRIVATCGSAAFLGGYLTMVVPLATAIALAPSLPRPWWRPLAALTALLSAVALVMTYARAAWLAVVLALAFVLWERRHDRRGMAVLAAGLLLAIAVASGAARLAGSWSPAERAASAVRLSEGSLPQRLRIARDTLPMIRDHLLLGVGPDAYGQVFQRYESPALLATGRGGLLQTDRAHNDLLQIASTQGLAGLAAWLVFLVMLARAAARAISRNGPGWIRAVLVGSAAACVAYLVQAQFEFSTFVLTPLFWALAGILWSAGDQRGSGEGLGGRAAEASAVTDAPGPGPVSQRPPAVTRTRTILAGAMACAAALSAVVAALFWDADVDYNRGIAALYAKDGAAAVSAYRSAVALDPVEPVYRAALGSALVSVASQDPRGPAPALAEAAVQFRAGRALAPLDTTVDFMAGNAYLEFGARKGDVAQAASSVSAYLRGLGHEPLAVDALTQLGRAYAYQGRWTDALAAWQRAARVVGRNAQLDSFMGRAYEKLGDKAKALEAYRAALAADPSNELAKSGLRSLEASAPAR